MTKAPPAAATTLVDTITGYLTGGMTRGEMLAVIPLHGKQPYTKDWTHHYFSLWEYDPDKDGPDDPITRTKKEWGGKNSTNNVGIVTGKPSGLIVLDIDNHDNDTGTKAIEALQEQYGCLPSTWTCNTGGGGVHLYFVDPGGLKNSAGAIAQSVDVRADGGQVVAPPSHHPGTGKPYTWAPGLDPQTVDLAILPPAWVEMLREKSGTAPQRAPQGATRSPSGAQWTDTGTRFEAPAEVQEGTRNQTLFKYGCSLRGKGAPDADIMGALEEYNALHMDPPLPATEVQTTARSVCKLPIGRSAAYMQRSAENDFLSWNDTIDGDPLAAGPANRGQQVMPNTTETAQTAAQTPTKGTRTYQDIVNEHSIQQADGSAIVDPLAVSEDAEKNGARPEAEQDKIPPECDTRLKPGDLSDSGNAELFCKIYSRSGIIYVKSMGWLNWIYVPNSMGGYWSAEGDPGRVVAMKFAQDMLYAAINAQKKASEIEPGKSNKTIKRWIKHAGNLRDRHDIDSMLALSAGFSFVPAGDLDADPYQLNTPAGIVDLKTGDMKAAVPRFLCTHITAAAPGQKGTDKWRDFLDLVTGGDTELIAYLQEVAGMAAIGRVTFEGIIILYGSGRNGKTTFLQALYNVMGTYSGTLDPAVLTTDAQSKRFGMAQVRGCRLVTSAELEEGARLSTKTLKALSSTDTVRIEEKYKDAENVTPSHHVLMCTNFLPRVSATDAGTWRRIVIVPFDVKMPDGKNDIKNYADVLTKEAGPAIMQWIVDGARRFIENGEHLDVPERVKQMTAEYKRTENWLQRFIDERCIVGPGEKVLSTVLYDEYSHYIGHTEYVHSRKDFYAELEKMGYERHKVAGHRFEYAGITTDRTMDPAFLDEDVPPVHGGAWTA